jgi:TolB protein
MKRLIFILVFVVFVSAARAQADKAFFYQSLAWSPDGKSLAVGAMSDYDEKTDDYRSSVFVMNADGSNLKKISGDAKHAFSPAWSPAGKRVFFGVDTEDGKESNIFSVRRDGSDLSQLTKNVGQNTVPSVSPDGKKIAFMSKRNGEKYQIYVMNTNGSDVRKLTTGGGVSFCNPIWSRDGKRIVYYTDKGDRRDQVWIMNSDGSNKTLLTKGTGHNIFPSFSPDGKRIIFARRDEKDAEKSYADASYLFVMNTDGSNLTRLSDINGFYARFSPDGKRLAFIAGKFPTNAIYIANADGSNVTKLTKQ